MDGEETGRTNHERQFSYGLANCNSRIAKKRKSSQALSAFRLAALEKIRIAARRLAESLCGRLFYESLPADVDSFQASEPDISGGLRVRNAEFFGCFSDCQITGDACRADHAAIIAKRLAICKRIAFYRVGELLDDAPVGPPPRENHAARLPRKGIGGRNSDGTPAKISSISPNS